MAARQEKKNTDTSQIIYFFDKDSGVYKFMNITGKKKI